MDSDTGEVEYGAFIGLDWGSEKHSVALKAAGSNEIETYTLKQTPEEVHAWLTKLRDKFGGRPVAIALEQTKGAVIHALLGYDFVHIFRINPKSLADYRKAFSPGGAKDDPTDAEYLLEWVELHRNRIKPWVADDVQTRCLQKLVEFRREVVNQRVAFTNQLTQVLKEYFPQALDWGGEIDRVMFCDFLSKWPTLEKIKKARPETIRTFYRQHGCRSGERIEERLKALCTARALTEDAAVIATSVCMVQTIVRALYPIFENIARLDKEIEARFSTHPDMAIFDSFPGAGPVLAPRLLAAMGSDRSRFDSASEVQQYSGIAPVTERSGKHMWIHRRFACPRFLRQTFHEFAGQSIKFCAWARGYYDMKRASGMGHHASVRALAYKWIRIIFRCWQDRAPYDDAVYVRALHKKRSAIVGFMKKAA
ncbi:MAG TPA: IS110 family transposase [Acidobacteriota bacterium]|nr:IS110 family transposase [Acidobacteriota bacterium]